MGLHLCIKSSENNINLGVWVVLRARPCCMTDYSKEASSVLSALPVNGESPHCRQWIDGQSEY